MGPGSPELFNQISPEMLVKITAPWILLMILVNLYNEYYSRIALAFGLVFFSIGGIVHPVIAFIPYMVLLVGVLIGIGYLLYTVMWPVFDKLGCLIKGLIERYF